MARVTLGLRDLFHAACVAHDAIGGPSLGGAALAAVRERTELRQAVERLVSEASERQEEFEASEWTVTDTLTRERDEARSESATYEAAWKAECSSAIALRQQIHGLESDVRLYVRDCEEVARQRDAALEQAKANLADVDEAKFHLRALLLGVSEGIEGVPDDLDNADLATLLAAVQVYACHLETRADELSDGRSNRGGAT
mgnify:CR=1 FL=1